MTPAELAQQWMATAEELGLLFANCPDEQVAVSLEQMRRNLIDKFCALFPMAPPETMAAGVDSIMRHIQDRKCEIERDAITADRSKSN
jgi:hypothetical protein